MVIIRPNAHVARRPSLSRLVAVIVLVAGAAALAACGTTEGFGKDVKNLGGNIEDSAAENN
jgi:predicted small secreted protein